MQHAGVRVAGEKVGGPIVELLRAQRDQELVALGLSRFSSRAKSKSIRAIASAA
jgi:hypothetical protein